MNDLLYLKEQNARTKKLINKTKIGDWVLTESGSSRFSPIKRQLFRIDGIVESQGDFRIYESNEIYTNFRLTKEFANKPFFNSLGIVEIVPKELIDNYIESYNMWKSDKYNIEPINI